jgi:hypothetical protein
MQEALDNVANAITVAPCTGVELTETSPVAAVAVLGILEAQAHVAVDHVAATD